MNDTLRGHGWLGVPYAVYAYRDGLLCGVTGIGLTGSPSDEIDDGKTTYEAYDRDRRFIGAFRTLAEARLAILGQCGYA